MSEEEQKYFKGLIGFTFDSDDIKYIEKIIGKKDKEIERLTELCNKYEEEHKTVFEEWKKTINIINELKEWFKGYHKSYASCKWYEEDYIEFIEHLENELKGSDKE